MNLASSIKRVRTVWKLHRITRFTFRSWRYRFKIWLSSTQPQIPMIDWAGFDFPEWTEADRIKQREAWEKSQLLAFWLCPDGIDAGVAAHDRFVRLVKKNPSKKDDIISEIVWGKKGKPYKDTPRKNNKKKPHKDVPHNISEWPYKPMIEPVWKSYVNENKEVVNEVVYDYTDFLFMGEGTIID